MNTQSNDNAGKRFGRWTVIQPCYPEYPRKKYVCRCDCGTISEISIWHMENGHSNMCNKHILEKKNSHGMTKTKVYKTWLCMKGRCYDKTHKSYPDYGGRGILICERWKNNFKNFLSDMGQPEKGQSIDRIDYNSGYYPENCKWSTWTEQANNRRSNKLLTAFGETKTIANWSRDYRCLCSFQILLNRYNKPNEWSHEKAITTPANQSQIRRNANHFKKKAIVWRAV